MKRYSLFIFLLSGLLLANLNAQVTISEIHYTDVNNQDAVELTGVSGTNLAGWQLLLYDGYTGSVYDSHIFDVNDVVEVDATAGTQQLGVIVTRFQQLQDQMAGVALVDPNDVVQEFWSYGGRIIGTAGAAQRSISNLIDPNNIVTIDPDLSLIKIDDCISSPDFSASICIPEVPKVDPATLSNIVTAPDLQREVAKHLYYLNEGIEDAQNRAAANVSMTRQELEAEAAALDYTVNRTLSNVFQTANSTLGQVDGTATSANETVKLMVSEILFKTDQTMDDAVEIAVNTAADIQGYTVGLVDYTGQIYDQVVLSGNETINGVQQTGNEQIGVITQTFSDLQDYVGGVVVIDPDGTVQEFWSYGATLIGTSEGIAGQVSNLINENVEPETLAANLSLTKDKECLCLPSSGGIQVASVCIPTIFIMAGEVMEQIENAISTDDFITLINTHTYYLNKELETTQAAVLTVTGETKEALEARIQDLNYVIDETLNESFRLLQQNLNQIQGTADDVEVDTSGVNVMVSEILFKTDETTEDAVELVVNTAASLEGYVIKLVDVTGQVYDEVVLTGNETINDAQQIGDQTVGIVTQTFSDLQDDVGGVILVDPDGVVQEFWSYGARIIAMADDVQGKVSNLIGEDLSPTDIIPNLSLTKDLYCFRPLGGPNVDPAPICLPDVSELPQEVINRILGDDTIRELAKYLYYLNRALESAQEEILTATGQTRDELEAQIQDLTSAIKEGLNESFRLIRENIDELQGLIDDTVVINDPEIPEIPDTPEIPDLPNPDLPDVPEPQTLPDLTDQDALDLCWDCIDGKIVKTARRTHIGYGLNEDTRSLEYRTSIQMDHDDVIGLHIAPFYENIKRYGLAVTGKSNISLMEGGLQLKRGLELLSGNLNVHGGSIAMSSGSIGMATGKIYVQEGFVNVGDTTAAHVRVTPEQLTVNEGNLTVNTGEVAINDGNLTVSDGNVKVGNGSSNFNLHYTDDDEFRIFHDISPNQAFEFDNSGSFTSYRVNTQILDAEQLSLENAFINNLKADTRVHTGRLLVADPFYEDVVAPEFETDIIHTRWTQFNTSGMSLRHLAYGPNRDESWQFYVASNGNLWLHEDKEFIGYFNENSGAYLRTSDRKLKNNIQRIDNQVAQLKQLKPSTYRFKKQKDDQLQYGFIAQELQEVYPAMVSEVQTDGEGAGDPLLAVDYEALIPVLVAGWQQQQATLEEQTTVVETLQTENELLHNRLEQLETQLAKLLATAVTESTTTVELYGAEASPYLKQNTPNPFTDETMIEYFLPAQTQTASLRITDMQGKLIKLVELTETGKGQVKLLPQDFPSGTYAYALIIDGEVVASRQMVMQR